MKNKIIFFLIGVIFSVSAFAFETANVRFTKKDGTQTTKQVKMQKHDEGFYRVCVPVADIKRDIKFIDVIADKATANKGEKGFFILGDSSYGEFTQDKGLYVPTWSHMPIFGMQNSKGSFVAIVKGLVYEQRPAIEAENGKYAVYARYQIGNMYFDAYEDIVVDFYPLAKGAGYSEMAKVYRDYQLGRGEVKLLRERIKNNPTLAYTAESIYVRIKHCRKVRDGRDMSLRMQTVETEPPLEVYFTFDDLARIMRDMKSEGIDKAEICSVGWNVSGHDGRFPQYFPVEEKIGGEKKYREVIKLGKSMGYQLNCHINQMAMFFISDRWNENDVAKRADGSLFADYYQPSGMAYRPCFQRVHDLWIRDDFPQIKNLGLNGIFHVDVTSYIDPFECCDPRHPLTRKQTAEYQNKINAYAQKIFGGFASEGCMDHVAKTLDYGLYLWAYPAWEGKPERLATKHVPFWQLVYHGIILSNPYYTTIDALYPKKYSTSDQRKAYDYLDNPENRWLKVIEFSGRPTFYYSDYVDFKPMRRAYEEFKKLRHLQLQLMTYHGELAKNVSITRFESGEEIVVNYTEKPYTYKGQQISAKSYKHFK